MQRLFADTRPLDRKAVDEYDLTEDILMENAAAALELEIFKRIGTAKAACLIVTGTGNNGGDGSALARRLAGKMTVMLFSAKKPVPPVALRQFERAQRLRGAPDFFITDDFGKAADFAKGFRLFEKAVVVECLFGSGFHGILRHSDEKILDWLNTIPEAVKIACDIPGGIDKYGNPAQTETGTEQKAFRADSTVTMGALKISLFSSKAKDYIGSICCADLGIARSQYESPGNSECQPEAFLLENGDLVSPVRTKQAVNKGTFGHTVIIAGEKPGAAVIAGSAAFAYGTGLVTLVKETTMRNIPGCPPELMQSDGMPENTTAVAAGMGLGRNGGKFRTKVCTEIAAHPEFPFVLDADLFYYDGLPGLLSARSRAAAPTILTPHPKEFLTILNQCNIPDENGDAYTLQKIQKNEPEAVRRFCNTYPGLVLVLKDANTIIACQVPETVQSSAGRSCTTGMQLFISPLGKNCLAKGGSGDVLAGVIAALLSQKEFLAQSGTIYQPLFAALQAVLAHAAAARKIETSWGMTPFMLIEKLRENGKS